MLLLFHILLAIVFSLLLVKSAEWMISSSSRLAKHFNISEYTISFLVIAFATSLPELMVGVVSALDKNPILSYGNVLGSNIADLTIILAIPILVGGAIRTEILIKNKDLIYTGFFGVLPLILMFDGLLSQIDGIILVLSYIFYLFLVLRRSSTIAGFIESFHYTNILKDLSIFIFSLLLLLGSADVLVKIAENFSVVAGLPLIFVGLILTALGTSLPELAFGLKAIKTNHKEEVLGNIVGSVVSNSTLVLGVTAIIKPIERNGNIGASSVGFLLLTLVLFMLFSFRKELGRVEAIILIGVYVVFVIFEQTLI